MLEGHLRESRRQGGCRRGGGCFGKERSWAAQVEAQGKTFYSPAIEAGGAVNERFREFIVALASSSSSSPSERDLFLGCALQRIRVVSLKGVCAIILGRPTPLAPPVVCTRMAPFRWRSPNCALWARPSPLVGLQLVDLRGGPRPAAGLRLGGGACPRRSQLAPELLNFLSRALRPPPFASTPI